MVNPIEIQSSLEGVEYPIDKMGLMKYAKKHGASDEVLDALDELPDQDYNNVTEVSSQFKKAEGDDDVGVDVELLDSTDADDMEE